MKKIFFLLTVLTTILLAGTMTQAQQKPPHPLAGALFTEQTLLQQDYENRISAFISKITESDQFHVSVDVKLAVFSRNGEEPPDIQAESAETIEKALPGFEFPHIKSLLKLSLENKELMKDESLKGVLNQAAHSPIDIYRLKITILLDDKLAQNSRTIPTIKQYIPQLVPFKLSRGDELLVNGVDFSITARNQAGAMDSSGANANNATTRPAIKPSDAFFGIALLLLLGAVVFIIRQQKILNNRIMPAVSAKTVITKPASVTNDPNQTVVAKANPFDFLSQIDRAKQIAIIQDEPPRVIALILTYLSPQDAGEIFTGLPGDVRNQVVPGMLSFQGVSKEVIADVRRSLQKKVQVYLDSEFVPGGGVQGLARIISWAPEALAKETLNQVKLINHDRALELGKHLFTFESLVNLEDNLLREITQKISLEHLGIALEGASVELAAKFQAALDPAQLKNLQKLKDDSGKISTKRVEVMRHEVMALVKKALVEKQIDLSVYLK